MLTMLIAYNADGEVIATLDYMAARDENGEVIGLIDFSAHEEAGGKLTDVWNVDGAVGSGTWPEWIGSKAHDFKVEVDPRTKRITALKHKQSGYRRNRAEIEDAIARRIADTPDGKPADIRNIVGGPERPLLLDENGRSQSRRPVTRPTLPLVPRSKSEEL